MCTLNIVAQGLNQLRHGVLIGFRLNLVLKFYIEYRRDNYVLSFHVCDVKALELLYVTLKSNDIDKMV